MQLSRGARRCLNLIQWYAARFAEVFPYQKTIAQKLGMCVRQIGRYIRELVAAGYLRVRRNGPTSCTYEVLKALERKLVTSENVRSLSEQCPIKPPASIYESGSGVFNKLRRKFTSKKPMGLYERLKAQGYPGFV